VTDGSSTCAQFDVARVARGRIAEHWGAPDRFAMLAQTGVLDRLA